MLVPRPRRPRLGLESRCPRSRTLRPTFTTAVASTLVVALAEVEVAVAAAATARVAVTPASGTEVVATVAMGER